MIEIARPVSTRITGTVAARTGRRHTVTADDGRILLADSATPYPPGSRVTVLADAILGPAGRAPSTTSYQEV